MSLVTAIVAPVAEPLPIAVLVSGAGTNLQALLDTVHGREAADRGGRLEQSPRRPRSSARARPAGVPDAVFARADYPDRDARDEALADWLAGARRAPGRAGAGYMELLGAGFLARFPGAVINVHPSLLPAFPGLHAIEQALAYGVKVFGVTVHFVDAGVDTGPVILQRAVELPRRARARGGARARCARSSTRCCPRPCACSRAARSPPTRRTRAG